MDAVTATRTGRQRRGDHVRDHANTGLEGAAVRHKLHCVAGDGLVLRGWLRIVERIWLAVGYDEDIDQLDGKGVVEPWGEARGPGQVWIGLHNQQPVRVSAGPEQLVSRRSQMQREIDPPVRVRRRGLRSHDPRSDVCVLDVEEESDKFHARHDAVARTYLYQISTRRTAFFKKYVWWVREPLDIPLMSRAARMLAGRHNFICFRAPDPSRPDESTIVVVDDAAIEEDGHLILFRITGSHFLWRMVRRIVGVLVKVGKGEITLDEFGRLLEGQADPRLDVAAWTAPASGLFLEKVEYPRGRP